MKPAFIHISGHYVVIIDSLWPYRINNNDISLSLQSIPIQM